MIELFGHNNPTSEIQATVRLLFVAGLWAINHCESGRAATASCHSKLPQTGRLAPWKLIVSQFRRPEVPDQVVGGGSSFSGPWERRWCVTLLALVASGLP